MTQQTRRFGLLLAALATLALAGTALALPPGPFQGKPTLQRGKQLGAAVWHDADGLHVRFTTKGKKQRFNGTVCATERITNLEAKKLEKKVDFIKLSTSGKCVEFSFTTKGGVDGFDFRAGGAEVTFDLKIGAVNLPSKNIWLGARGVHPGNSPFVLDRR